MVVVWEMNQVWVQGGVFCLVKYFVCWYYFVVFVLYYGYWVVYVFDCFEVVVMYWWGYQEQGCWCFVVGGQYFGVVGCYEVVE